MNPLFFFVSHFVIPQLLCFSFHRVLSLSRTALLLKVLYCPSSLKDGYTGAVESYVEMRKLTLPFGAMICKLLIEAGCQIHPHELPIPKRQKIDRRTKAMSESHAHNRLQGETVRVQANEDDEDSIENRFLAIENAVFDQPLQIEQLEEKVTSGFNDLWNQLTEMFNHLRQH